ncbi:MAG TPA: PaaI family thioesterase [Terriglobales bacterium]|nr:PaaI family thioesterase [Terriglobales bacterium]
MARRTSAAGHGSKAHPLKKNLCFGCGVDNPEGMHLKFFADRERGSFFCRFRLGKRFTGPPGYCHGGIIATILDEAMSKLNKKRDIVAATAQMKIEYLRPIPLRQPLHVQSHEISKRGRRLTRVAEILDENGTVLARSRGVFVIVDPHRVFKRK